jgi:ribosomal protein S11
MRCRGHIAARLPRLACRFRLSAGRAEKAAPRRLTAKSVEVRIKGPASRESAVRPLNALGYKVTNIVDVTPIPHNPAVRRSAAEFD